MSQKTRQDLRYKKWQDAEVLQSQLLPQAIPFRERLDIAAVSETAPSVGGDYFDFRKVSDTHLAVILTDVSASGEQAVRHAHIVKDIFHSLAPNAVETDDFARHANQAVLHAFDKGVFVTAVFALINVDTSIVSLVRCGHCYPLLWRGEKSEVLVVTPEGPGLGILSEAERPKFEEKQISLNEKDCLLLYTDGVMEANNQEREEYGMERLVHSLARHAGENSANIVASILGDVHVHASEVRDDMTVMALKWMH